MFRKMLIGGAAAATLVLAGTGVALAVSDGGYRTDRQHCSPHADDATEPDRAEPGCHSNTVQLDDSNGHDYADVGIQQQPDHEDDPLNTDYYGGEVFVDGVADQPVGYQGNPDDSSGWTNPPAGNPADGMTVYFGSDDNLNFGEHDNSPQGSGGPSDGGSWEVNVSPASVATWMAAVTSGNLVYLTHNPLPLVNAHVGMGADGHDAAVTTNQRTVYEGECSPDCPPPRDAGDYSNMTWDPPTCAGPSDTAQDCGGQSLQSWDRQRGTTYAEPGVQVYEDPDPQGSPVPAETWPQPAAAVTTCGVYVGGGPANFSGAPATNDAGQVQAENPNCSDTNGG